MDAAAWAKAFQDGKDAEGWSARIGKLGIGADSKVVVYDDNSFIEAARVWWILRYWGVDDVRLLNGNWTTWKKTGLTIETGKPKPPSPVAFTAKPRSERLATKGLVLASLKDSSLQIVDARSEAEFCGTDKHKNKRAGAIPGAKHLEWIDLIDKETQRFKTPDQLRALRRRRDPTRPADGHALPKWRQGLGDGLRHGAHGGGQCCQLLCKLGRVGNADDTPIVPGKAKAVRAGAKITCAKLYNVF